MIKHISNNFKIGILTPVENEQYYINIPIKNYVNNNYLDDSNWHNIFETVVKENNKAEEGYNLSNSIVYDSVSGYFDYNKLDNLLKLFEKVINETAKRYRNFRLTTQHISYKEKEEKLKEKIPALAKYADTFEFSFVD